MALFRIVVNHYTRQGTRLLKTPDMTREYTVEAENHFCADQEFRKSKEYINQFKKFDYDDAGDFSRITKIRGIQHNE